MGYSVIYLDGRKIEGKGKLPGIGCNVCRDIKRNVIEPVAIFLKEEKLEEIENKLVELQEKFGNQEKTLKEKIKELAKEIHEEQDGKTCIFHCEKESEVWSHEEIRNLLTEKIGNYILYIESSDQGTIDFRNFHFPEQFSFQNQKFLKRTDFSNSIFKEIKFLKVSFHDDTFFENCQCKLFYFENCKLERVFFRNFNSEFLTFNQCNCQKLTFDEKCKIADLDLTGKFEYIKLKDSNLMKVEGQVDCDYLYTYKLTYAIIDFSGSSFKEFNLINADIKVISNYYPQVCLEGCSFDHLIIKDTSSYYLDLGGSKIKSGIISNLKEFQEIHFEYSHIEGLKFSNIIYPKAKITIRNSSIIGSSLSDSKLKEIELCKSKIVRTSISNSYIEDIFVSNAKCKELTLADLKVNNLTAANITTLNSEDNNSIVFILRNTYCNETLSIINFLKGKVKSINLDISKAQDISIIDSFIGNFEFNSTKWGKVSEGRICRNLFEKEPAKARDAYRQLKLAHENQMDYITANQFYALEMRTYEKQLKDEGWTRDNWQDRMVFILHKWISNFGISYLRPLIILILITNLMVYLSLIDNQNKEFFPLISSLLTLASSHFVFFTSIYILLLVLTLTVGLFYGRIINIIKGCIESSFRLEMIILISSLVISLDIFIINLSLLSKFGGYLDKFAEMLNIAKVFKDNSNNHFSGFKLVYTVYSILAAVLIYQFILAIRRRVKR